MSGDDGLDVRDLLSGNTDRDDRRPMILLSTLMLESDRAESAGDGGDRSGIAISGISARQ